MSRFSGVLVLAVLCLLAAVCPISRAEDAGESVYYSANALYNRKLFTLAVGEYKTFLERHPTHEKVPNATHGLALSYYSLGKYAEAEPLLQKAIGFGNVGDGNRLRALRGQCLLRLGKPAEAAPMFDTVAKSPDAGALKATALAGLAESHFKREDWTATIAAADALLGTEPTGAMLIRALYQAGYARHRLAKYQDAIPLLSRLLGKADDGALKKQAAFLLGECYRETGDLDQAAEHYVQATGLEGAGPEISYRLGHVRFTQKLYADALVAFRASLKQEADGPYAASARVYVGRALLGEKKADEAILWLTPLTTDAKTGDEASLWLARAQVDKADYAAAAATLKDATTRYPQSPFIHALRFDYANALIATGDFKTAEPLVGALARDPQWAQKSDALRLHAVCLHHGQDFAGSLAAADAFLATHKDAPHAADVLFLKAENLFMLDRLPQALAAYQVFLAAQKDHAQADAAAVRLSRIHHRQGEWEKALTLAEPLLGKQLGPTFMADLRFIVADSRFRLERWADAVAMLTAFLDSAAQDDVRRDTALIEIAIAHQRTGNEPGAIAAFNQLAKTHPNSPHRPTALAELGRMHYEAGRHAEARQALEACLAANPQAALRAQATYTLGWVALAQKKADEALKHFQWIVTSAPTHPLANDAGLQIGLLQLAAGKYRDAGAALQGFLQANAKHPDAPTALYSLGVAEARSKSWQNAASRFKQFVDAHPDSEYADRALYEWAWCEKELKRPAEAAKRYNTLLEKHPASELASKVRTELAELSFAERDYDAVIAELEKTLPSLKEPALREQTLYRLGTAYFNTEVFDKSASTFEMLAQDYPASTLLVSALLQAGESRLKLGETVAAREHFMTVTGKNPDAKIMETALLRLGEAQSLTKQWPQAAATYGRFLKAYPTSTWLRRVQFGHAFALEKQGQYEPAMAAYKSVLANGKRDEMAARSRFQTGESLFALKRYDDAVKEFIRVTVDFGYEEWTAKALLEVGRALEAKGDTERAMDQFREVIKKYPAQEVGVVAKQRLDALRRTL